MQWHMPTNAFNSQNLYCDSPVACLHHTCGEKMVCNLWVYGCIVHFAHTSPSLACPAMPDLSQLQRFRQKVPFCSQSALEGILDLASKEGIPESYKRKQIRQSVEQTIGALNTYGPLLVAATAMTLAEEPMDIVFANIFSYIAGAYAAGGCFAIFLDKVHSKKPSDLVDTMHLGIVFCMQMKFTQVTS